MKLLALLFISILSILQVAAQSGIEFYSGPYTTSDGKYTLTIERKEGKLIIIEPNKRSEYIASGDNVYIYTNPKNGLRYKMIVMNKSTLASYSSSGNAKTDLHFSGDVHETKNEEEFGQSVNLTDKYHKKMETDAKDAQLWAFCAAAAMQKGMLNEEGFTDYAKATILAMRQLLIDQSKCPCEDVIPDALWQSTK